MRMESVGAFFHHAPTESVPTVVPPATVTTGAVAPSSDGWSIWNVASAAASGTVTVTRQVARHDRVAASAHAPALLPKYASPTVPSSRTIPHRRSYARHSARYATVASPPPRSSTSHDDACSVRPSAGSYGRTSSMCVNGSAARHHAPYAAPR